MIFQPVTLFWHRSASFCVELPFDKGASTTNSKYLVWLGLPGMIEPGTNFMNLSFQHIEEVYTYILNFMLLVLVQFQFQQKQKKLLNHIWGICINLKKTLYHFIHQPFDNGKKLTNSIYRIWKMKSERLLDINKAYI